MKTVIKFFTMFTLLIASADAMSTALHNPVNIATKRKIQENIPSSNELKITPYHFIKAADLTIDSDTSNNAIALKNMTGSGRLKRQADLIRDYARVNNYSMEYCFLVDMSIPSGKKRFFVYNLRKDSLEFSAMVSHGFGSTQKEKDCEDQLMFSNMPYSFKTSLGKYKIGKPYKGTYGLSYKLYGLDSTNNRAFERAIVLHSDLHVPENETFPGRIYQSAGCPTVTPNFLPILGSFIKSSKKPILMWIYN